IFSTRVELFLLQTFAGAHVVGLFGGALRIVESLLTLPTAIAAGALPSVARDAVRGSRGAAQRMLGLVIWLGVPSAVGLTLCASDVLSILGPGFVEGAPALRVLSLALLLCFSNAALFHILIAAGETAVIPRFTAMRVGTAVALGLLTVPPLGLVGAALSFTAAEFTLFAVLVRRTRIHAGIEVGRPIASALAASLPMAALLLWWPLSLPASIAFGTLLFAVTAAAMLRRGAEANGLA
ncbi:MAG: polysaccharide biosynthesis C-terminal domain-containing protein, partial [Vicinamibacteria bacterium]|nr:polysaccharide biosynthesis C-terminal domain-containing protein [Vicinamibacteria bacterium]